MKKLWPYALSLALALAPPCLAADDAAHIQKLEAMHREAEHLVVLNDFPGAIRAYQDILFLEPDDETAYANLGRCYLLRGEYDRAKEAFFNALDINPENETAQRGLEKIRNPDA
ncbi:MAG TPA: tetratricopeptide repeat protein [Candidatus Eisenbacteria bacterium]|jgi:tetratricopeptide (TPR) repeat protein|nr:tetratricopeptide repeat protein [Candidatus Eisenbacteria bacterium]